MAENQQVTVETLKQFLEAFNRHDLDSIMEFVRRLKLSDTWGELLREAFVAPKLTKMNYTMEPAPAS